MRLALNLPENHPLLKSGRNVLEVQAYNTEGYMRSRGLEFRFDEAERPEAEKPQVWLVASGVAKYRGAQLNLRFAAKDAHGIASALDLGAKRLFGTDKVHARVLSSTDTDPANAPTRANLVAALEEARAAKAQDILVVYLAGHGVTAGGRDGDFYYLCADAASDDLRDEAVRDQVALSSAKLTELLKQIPALKQVMILDTCAAGRVIEELTLKRDVPSNQTRALDRLKDRTGTYLLAGCAADAVSYEASRYGQGVLTYSLLMGLRGAALREERFVDVERLFNYSVDTVPELAGSLGGIQRPRISAPDGSSFDIGELSAEDRSLVPLQAVLPVVVRSGFQEATMFDDVLGLGPLVDDLLRERAALPNPRYHFVDGRGLPDSYRLVGRYTRTGDQTTVAVNVYRDAQLVHSFSIPGSPRNPAEIAQKLVDQFDRTLSQPPAK
jgi:hypothetical protein